MYDSMTDKDDVHAVKHSAVSDPSKFFKGVIAVIAASVAYGIMPIFTKTALNEGMKADSVVFYRFILSTLFSAVFLWKAACKVSVSRKQFFHLLVFGILGFGLTINLLTVSYQYIPVGLATMFHFAYPLVILFVMALFYKEKMTLFKAAVILIAIAGIFLLADFSQGLSPKGAAFALLSAVTYAAFIIAGRKSSFSAMPSMEVIFFVCLFSSVIFGGKSVLAGTLQLPPSITAMGCLLVISLVCTVFALKMLTYGIRTLGASTSSMLNMLEPVVSVIAGTVIFSEALNIRTITGCFLIVAASILTVKGDRQ